MRNILLALICLLNSTACLSAVPGIEYPQVLENRLKQALARQAKNDSPRTQHLCNNSAPCFTNRLILEDSPYLQQHAHNPVNWYSWSEEALETARRENKPVFLSIGYSTCHWCHVMEKESFDDLEVADILNKYFIAIKVDREQRPDIDELYGYVPVITGKLAGWPTTILLKGNGDAFYGGVYYPKKELMALLHKAHKTWTNDKAVINRQADVIMSDLRTLSRPVKSTKAVTSETINKALTEIAGDYDPLNGGFGDANKFPNESWLLFLLEVLPSMDKTNAEVISNMLQSTLDAMASGAIHDHVNGGFHRYTVDPQWTEPHFEKMLYNQALLIRVYLKAAIVFSRKEYLMIARETADFVLGNMTAKNGMFWSAMDADSIDPATGKAAEGAYYTWNTHQLGKLLSAQQLKLMQSIYYVNSSQNEPLHRKETLTDIARSRNIHIDKLYSDLRSIHKTLVSARRVKPGIDSKHIVSWNSMFIGSLALLASHTDSDRYSDAAATAADFIWLSMRKQDILYRIYFRGNTHTRAQLEDYAWYLDALAQLYSLDQNRKWHRRADQIVAILKRDFRDQEHGGFFHTAEHNASGLQLRNKSATDRSMPSANPVVIQAIAGLARQNGIREYRKIADETENVFAADARQIPASHASLLTAHLMQKSLHILKTVYAANGNIIISIHYRPVSASDYSLTMDINIRKGWHINSSKPLEDYLVPTGISLSKSGFNSGWQLSGINYPQPLLHTPGFSKNPLSLYEKNITITGVLGTEREPGVSPVINVKLQACNNNSCLPPESIDIMARPLEAGQ